MMTHFPFDIRTNFLSLDKRRENLGHHPLLSFLVCFVKGTSGIALLYTLEAMPGIRSFLLDEKSLEEN